MSIFSFAQGVYYGRYEKLVHVFISFVLTWCGSLFMPVGSAAAAVFAIGILKELYDARRVNDHFDIYDTLANCAGIALGVSAALM